MPLHGLIEPGDTQPIQFMFFGHQNISADVTAACKVEGGPTYELKVSGQASQIQYQFNTKTLDLGVVPYDHVHSTQLVLQNRGKVNFNFAVQWPKLVGKGDSMWQPGDSMWQPGDILVSPMSGQLKALEKVTFMVSFLPGIPEVFSKTLEFQVAHFAVDEIALYCQAVYPKLTMNLPRDFTSVASEILKEAECNISPSQQPHGEDSPDGDNAVMHTQQDLENEVEQLLMISFIAQNASKLFSGSGKNRTK